MSIHFKPKNSYFTALLAFAFAFAFVCFAPTSVEAKRKRRRKTKRTPVVKINKEALAELKGEFKFGMSKDDVLGILSKQLKSKYKEQIQNTSDIYTQDALRRKQNSELKTVRKSYVEFQGKKTGWDVSIIDDQFGHSSDESMLVYWEHNADGNDQRRFFFFYMGNLYKMYVILNSKILPPEKRNFEFFREMMAKRYGPGKLVTKKKRNGKVIPVLMDWASSKVHVQAIDKLSFYGSFCLSVADPSVESSLLSIRNANKKSKKASAITNAVLEKSDDAPISLDANSNALDKALGN